MGGSVMLLMKPGEANKIMSFFTPGTDLLSAPVLKGYDRRAHCWIECSGNKIDIGYSFGGMHNGEWANAIAVEIIKRFKVRKAGWDSIGYCDDINSVLKARPFSMYLEDKGIIGILAPKKKMRQWQAVYEGAAGKIFERAIK
jgi:hypothetical protein